MESPLLTRFRLQLRRSTLKGRWYRGEISTEQLLKDLAKIQEIDGEPVTVPCVIDVKKYVEAAYPSST